MKACATGLRGHYLSTMTFTTTTFQSSRKAGGEPALRNMPSCSTFDLSMYQQNLNYISPHWKLWKRKPEGNHRRNNKLTGTGREGASGFSSGLSFCEIYGRPCFSLHLSSSKGYRKMNAWWENSNTFTHV